MIIIGHPAHYLGIQLTTPQEKKRAQKIHTQTICLQINLQVLLYILHKDQDMLKIISKFTQIFPVFPRHN